MPLLPHLGGLRKYTPQPLGFHHSLNEGPTDMASTSIANARRPIATIALSLSFVSAIGASSLAGNQEMSVIAHAASGPISCEILKSDLGNSVHLTGVISSSEAIGGNFRFLVTKSGPSGTSNINQGNGLNLVAGAEARVSNVTINLRHGDRATVELIVTGGGGIACRAHAILDL